MGPTKTGKSTVRIVWMNLPTEFGPHSDPHASQFLNSIIGFEQFEVGKKLASCTSILAAYVVPKAKVPTSLHRSLQARRIVLLDTPGFDDTHMGDEEILSRIAEWLTAS